jgi:hypothetical protein
VYLLHNFGKTWEDLQCCLVGVTPIYQDCETQTITGHVIHKNNYGFCAIFAYSCLLMSHCIYRQKFMLALCVCQVQSTCYKHRYGVNRREWIKKYVFFTVYENENKLFNRAIHGTVISNFFISIINFLCQWRVDYCLVLFIVQ